MVSLEYLVETLSLVPVDTADHAATMSLNSASADRIQSSKDLSIWMNGCAAIVPRGGMSRINSSNLIGAGE